MKGMMLEEQDAEWRDAKSNRVVNVNPLLGLGLNELTVDEELGGGR
jgi:hypothetical protein